MLNEELCALETMDYHITQARERIGIGEGRVLGALLPAGSRLLDLGERPQQEHPNSSSSVEADTRISRFELLGEPVNPLQQFRLKSESNQDGFVGHAATIRTTCMWLNDVPLRLLKPLALNC
jgi:hypothetical protein